MLVEGESAATVLPADGPLHRHAVGGFAVNASANRVRIGVGAMAQAVAFHNPLAYKADAADNYAVNGVWPAANGYF
jgi:hypothetical protein